MSELAVLYDPQNKRWLSFDNLVEVMEVYDLDEVLPTLASLEKRVEQDNLYAAGFVSYEAAPACDEALQTIPPGDLPLMRFALFSSCNEIKLPSPPAEPSLQSWHPHDDADEFADKVEQIRAAIARGETYQVNLTFPLTAEAPYEPWDFFLQLSAHRKSVCAAFLQNEHWAICSISPELFFCRDGEQITMRPMKGTAPRGRTLAEDRKIAVELQQSAKNRAENIMILDMVRNDLGRLAPPGTVHTEAICSLEKYATVWQLTSTVTATTRASLADVFSALFPCASITGAPKAQTMQIIAASESVPRQVYTGTIGWLAPGQQAHFNVAIRTALIDRRKQRATYGIGAGITWDSVGADEYRECLDKAAILKQPTNDFALIETLRWTPSRGYFVLREHLARLMASAEYFEFIHDEQTIMNYLDGLIPEFPPSAQRVRLLLHRDGCLEASYRPIEKPASRPVKLHLASEPIDSADVLLYHKTTQRQLYDRHLAEKPQADEVVLWNERGEVTECCTANLVIKKGKRLLTPKLSCGLLPGTYRDHLLKRGVIKEAVIMLNDLRACDGIYLINAVRKWRKATLCT